MKQFYIFVTVLAVLGNTGCKQKDDQTEEGNQAQSWATTAACPVCNKRMMEDAYCAGCNAVATTETDVVHCEACDKDYKPGTYCAECNRFMLNARVNCGNCQSKVVKGHYCTTEKLFKGLSDVAYCQEHGRPYDKSLDCPDCRKQAVETGT